MLNFYFGPQPVEPKFGLALAQSRCYIKTFSAEPDSGRETR